jgi:hypothetical protein
MAEAQVYQEQGQREEKRHPRKGRNRVLKGPVFHQRLDRKGDGEAR